MKSAEDFATTEAWMNYLKYYYAGQAIEGLCAMDSYVNYDSSKTWQQGMAKDSVLVANCLIAELNKQS